MNCPVCKTFVLETVTLDDGLPAYRCPNCTGVWLNGNEYLRWVMARPNLLPAAEITDAPIPTVDADTVKLCPDCGHMLRRFRVIPNVQFWLDRCGHCHGVWLDRQEWDALVARSLHDKVNQFFTQPWQTHMQRAESTARFEQLYRDKFGDADYARLRELDAWLRPHPQRAMLLAYLQSNDPYAV